MGGRAGSSSGGGRPGSASLGGGSAYSLAAARDASAPDWLSPLALAVASLGMAAAAALNGRLTDVRSLVK